MSANPPLPAPVCQVCGRKSQRGELAPASLVRPVIVERIRKSLPGWSAEGFICMDDLNRFRREYVFSLIEEERGELTDLDREVVESMASHEILSAHVDQEYEGSLDLGQRLSDSIARFGGSWKFITIFLCVMSAWMIVNSLLLVAGPFDPYPYILLNLVLSCLAALQAPIIMMSQNRQESKDRLRSAHDYQINLKAELEIRHLHQKIDHLLSRQWERLVEIQEIQLELLAEMRDKQRPGKEHHDR